jgi:hypothetical protein
VAAASETIASDVAPYTAAVDEKMKFSMPASTQASISTREATVLLA